MEWIPSPDLYRAHTERKATPLYQQAQHLLIQVRGPQKWKNRDIPLENRGGDSTWLWLPSQSVPCRGRNFHASGSVPCLKHPATVLQAFQGHFMEGGDLKEDLAKRVEGSAKNLIAPGLFFEELGFKYYGPVDGHDVLGLIDLHDNLKDKKGPIFLHIMTKKGKGYKSPELR